MIEGCHRLGYYVYAAGNMPQLIGHRHVDGYINSDSSDCEAILKTCSNLPQTRFFMFVGMLVRQVEAPQPFAGGGGGGKKICPSERQRQKFDIIHEAKARSRRC